MSLQQQLVLKTKIKRGTELKAAKVEDEVRHLQGVNSEAGL